MSEHLRWIGRPQLVDPVLIVAFEGWNDAGDAATSAVTYLQDHLGCSPCAAIDPEEFYDFTTARPFVFLDDNDKRQLRWPENNFSATTSEPQVVTMVGLEPQLKWRTYCDQILTVARAFNIKHIVTVGALLADVPHSRPVLVYGNTPDGPTADSEQGSGYEGPTGIVGVLTQACKEADMQTSSFWAAVPAYASQAVSGKATLALVERIADLVGVEVDLTELAISTASYERQVASLLEDDDELREYVTRLEADHDLERDIPAAEALVEQVEDFLRDLD